VTENSDSSLPNNIFSQLKEEVDAIIEQLNHPQEENIDQLVQLLLRRILARIGDEANSVRIAEELDRIIAELQQVGVLKGQQGILSTIKRLLQRGFSRDKQRNDKEKLDAQAQKECKRLLKLFITYELYKIASPNQLAGETQLENFRRNVAMRGADFAIDFSGKGEQAIEKMGVVTTAKLDAHFHKGGFLDMVHKERNDPQGWER